MTTRNSLLGACGRGSTWSAALAILVCQEASRGGGGAGLINLILFSSPTRQHELHRISDGNRPLGLYSHKASTELPVSAFQVDAFGYNAVLTACVKSRQWQQGIQAEGVTSR